MEYLLEMRKVSKSFPGVQALSEVSLAVQKGEVHALLGENGSGKSTLVKILSGAYQKDSGQIVMNGEEIQIRTPVDALHLGISTIYQELNLLEKLTVAENIFLGHHPMKKKHVAWESMFRDSQALLDELQINIDAHAIVSDLGIAYKQMVEIAKALSHDSRLIIMDEPTAPLTAHEIEILFEVVNRLKQRGVAIIYISHRLDEVMRICDTATIIRDGKNITTMRVSDTSIDEIIRAMVGKTIEEKYPKIKANIGDVLMEVKNLSAGKKVKDVSFAVHAGEILGITGLIGSGRTETVRAIFGIDRHSTGTVLIDGKAATINGPADAIRYGIGYVTEDRKNEGLVLRMDITQNITLASLKMFLRGAKLDLREEQNAAASFIKSMNIRTPSSKQIVNYLSGGNQQKVVLAKWLLSKARIIILDEPTRGIDVSAKVEVYNIINSLIERGAAVIMISSELSEMIGMADRIIVMNQGVTVFECKNDNNVSQERLMYYATGSNRETETMQ